MLGSCRSRASHPLCTLAAIQRTAATIVAVPRRGWSSGMQWARPQQPSAATAAAAPSLPPLLPFRPLHIRAALHLIDPTGPTAATFDAPLPTLDAPEQIDPSELQIDESAVQRLRALSAKAGHPVHLRVLVDQGGCSGLEYKFQTEHDQTPAEDDIVVSLGGESVWVDRDSWLWLRGSRIEYQQDLARSAFVVASNPNATQACGCKSSFAPKVDPRAVMAATNSAKPQGTPARL